jgi:two-component system, sensor histidine kinase and response regulator
MFPGVGVALLGALVLAGWVLQVEALKSIIPGADPMKPNMAVAILLCGAALSLLSRKTLTKPIRVCTAAIAATVIILSALTIGEYVFNRDLGIEHWLMGEVRADPEVPHPGRMAPITAVCFILVGAALFLASRQIQKRLRLPLVGALGGTLTAAGAVPLIGFLLEVLFGPSWNYMGVTPSGLAGAVAFLLLGIGLLELLRSNAHLAWSLDGFTTAGFVGGFTLMILAAGLTYNFTVKMQQGAAEVAHEQEVRRELNETEDDLLELEYDQRSYLITGNEHLLDGWDAKESEIREDLQKLQELEAGDSRQRKVLRQLAVLVAQRINRAKQTAAIRRERGLAAAQEMIATGAGAALREKSRGLIEVIASRGDARLRERQIQSDQASREVFLMLPLGVFVCFAVLTLGVFFLNSGAGERKRAEGALKEAERKYRGIFENAVEGIFQNTPDGHFVSANPALARMLGFESPEELISARQDIERQGYVDPTLRNKFIQMLEANGVVTGFEYEVCRKDGTRIWVAENSRIVRDAGGSPLYYEGSVQDITERKRAEAEREAISEIVQGVMTTSNLDELLKLAHRSIGKLLYAENCFVALHDTKSDLVHFEFWIDKFDPLPAPQPVGRGHIRTNSILRTGKPLVLTKELEARLCAQGAIAQTGSAAASWMGVPLRTPARTIGVLVVQHYEKEGAYSERDLAFLSTVGDQVALAIERKRADEELKRSEERLAAAQKMARVGSWEWDVITNEVVWSDEEYRLFGLEPGEHELTHQFFLSLVHPDARRDAMRWFNAVRTMKKSSRMDILIVRPDGEERILNSWAEVVLNTEGDVIRVVGTSQDVTEREKAERALAQSEERFQLVSRATADAIWDWDMIGHKISFSESFGTLFGYHAGEFESTMEFWMNAIHPDDHDNLRAGLDGFIAGREESWSAEYRFRCADGSYAFVFDRAYVVRDAAGKAVRMAGSMQDITESKRAEAELRESRAHLQLALQASNIGPWDWDLINNQVRFSREWKQQLGYAENEITSDLSEFSSRLHPEDAERIAAMLELCMADPSKEYDVEFRMRHKDGTYRWIHTRGSLHYDTAGRPVRMLGCHLDITDRRLAQEELREAKVAATLREGAERYNFLADTVPQIIWTARPDGGLDYYNKAWFDYTGLTLEETKDWGWGVVLHPDDLQHAIDRWTRSFTTGENYEVEYRFKRASDGAYRWHLGRALPMRDELGEIVQWVGTCTDIDDARCSKEMLQTANDELGLRVLERTSELHAAKEAAETANRAKSEFLANMSHEIRTPMNGIIGMTDLALETELNRDQREYLGMVKSSAHSLLGLINDILDFSKIEAGKLELESIEFSLRDCVGGMLKPLGIRADQKGLELVADIHSGVPDQLIGDSMRLRQILINLTDNAIKFTERGEIVISVSSQSITDDESELHFSVSDTGIGIPQEKQKAIFEAFAQADGSTTRTYGGTGLGLSIASQLIQKMGGRIWIESNVGEGTTFHFTARLGVRAALSPASHAEPQDLQGLRALVVDDNAVNRRMLSAMLLNWRMKPTVVASGAGALKEMTRAANANAAYEVVLLDAMMPEMDGFALAEKINEQPALAEATVMMLSSAMPAGTAERCSALGIAGWLSKPITQSELLDAILIAISRDKENGGSPDAQTQVPETGGAGSGLRILVAEDNLINRAVATGILEKAGHVLVHAANGREAVEAFSDGAFDLILMDVQMPEMDGFEATRRIRELEEATGGHIKIAAMTAHAMAGDRERCLAAGMDDYVSKPLRKDDLLRTVDGARIVGDRLETGTRFLYNREELLSQCDGDEDLMAELVSIFHDNTPRILRAVGEALEKGDAPALATQAHKLLSSLGVFGAGRARTLALRLEKHAEENDFGGARERFTELERETDKIYAALA